MLLNTSDNFIINYLKSKNYYQQLTKRETDYFVHNSKFVRIIDTFGNQRSKYLSCKAFIPFLFCYVPLFSYFPYLSFKCGYHSSLILHVCLFYFEYKLKPNLVLSRQFLCKSGEYQNYLLLFLNFIIIIHPDNYNVEFFYFKFSVYIFSLSYFLFIVIYFKCRIISRHLIFFVHCC